MNTTIRFIRNIPSMLADLALLAYYWTIILSLSFYRTIIHPSLHISYSHKTLFFFWYGFYFASLITVVLLVR